MTRFVALLPIVKLAPRRPHTLSGMLAALLLAAASTLPVGAQPAQPTAVRVVQRGDGALFVVLGTSAWPLVPDQISDDVFANLVTVGNEVDGTLPGPLELPPISGSVSLTSDGTLYYIQGTMGYPLVPDPIADSDLAALTLGSEIDGNVPRALWTDTTPTTVPATTDQPLAAVVPTVTTQSCTGVPTGEISGAPSYAPILAPCRMLTLGQPLTGALNVGHSIPSGPKQEAYYGQFGFGDPFVVHLLKDHKYLIKLDTNNYFGNGKEFYKAGNYALPDPKDGKGKVVGHAWVLVFGDGANLFLPNAVKGPPRPGADVNSNPTSIFRALFWAWQPSGTSCLGGAGTESAGFNNCVIQPLADGNFSLGVVRSGSELRLPDMVYEPPQYSLSISEAP